jgi:sugar transferase EpsL
MPHVLKRSFEFAVAGMALFVLGPVLVFIAIAIFFIDGRPILVPDVWTDRRGRSIALLAFRTEKMETDSLGAPLRVQRPLRFVGSFLRWSDLRELPRLLNVLRGDCSMEAFGPGSSGS